MKIRAQKTIYNGHIEIIFVNPLMDGSIEVAEPLKMKVVERHAIINQPTCELEQEEAQQLMDALWDCGLRPSEGTGSAGSLAATERHLKDMQRLVFKDKNNG